VSVRKMGPVESKAFAVLPGLDGLPFKSIQLPVPGSRLIPERVDEAGKPSSLGDSSRIVGPK